MPTVGLGIQTDREPRFYRELGLVAERSGFDVLSVFNDAGFPPAFPVLQTLAGVTNRILLGPACVNPFTMTVAEITDEFSRLMALSGGRGYLGLSRGAWLEPESQKRPLAALRSAIEYIRSQEPDSPRLLIGTWGPRTAAMAAELGVAEIKIGGTANPAMVETMLGYLGDTKERPDVVVGSVTVVDPDREAARTRAKQAVALYLPVVAPLDPTVGVDGDLLDQMSRRVAEGNFAGAGDLVTDEILDLFAMAGTPHEALAKAIHLYEAGAARVEFGSPFGLDSLAGVEILGSEVLPGVRRHLA